MKTPVHPDATPTPTTTAKPAPRVDAKDAKKKTAKKVKVVATKKPVKPSLPKSMTEWPNRRVVETLEVPGSKSAVLILECGHLRSHGGRTNFRCRPCALRHPRVSMPEARKAAAAQVAKLARRHKASASVAPRPAAAPKSVAKKPVAKKPVAKVKVKAKKSGFTKAEWATVSAPDLKADEAA